jgi:hypothetical protein
MKKVHGTDGEGVFSSNFILTLGRKYFGTESVEMHRQWEGEKRIKELKRKF